MTSTSLSRRHRRLASALVAATSVAAIGVTAVASAFPEVIPGRAPSTLVATAVVVNSSGAARPLAGAVVRVEVPASPIPGTIRERTYEQVTDASGVARFTLGNCTYLVVIPCTGAALSDPCAHGVTSLPDGRRVAAARPITMHAGTTVNLTLEFGR